MLYILGFSIWHLYNSLYGRPSILKCHWDHNQSNVWLPLVFPHHGLVLQLLLSSENHRFVWGIALQTTHILLFPLYDLLYESQSEIAILHKNRWFSELRRSYRSSPGCGNTSGSHTFDWLCSQRHLRMLGRPYSELYKCQIENHRM